MPTTASFDELQNLLAEIDALFDTYDPGEITPDRILGDIIAERAAQRHIFDRIVVLTTVGLEKFSFNAELLRRRAVARTYIVTPDMSYPEVEHADQDFQTFWRSSPTICKPRLNT